MNIDELKQRIQEIERLELHLSFIPVNTRLGFANAYNSSTSTFMLDETICSKEDQNSFIEEYKAKVNKKINSLKKQLEKDTTITDLS